MGRVTAMESTVQRIREVQEGQDLKNEILVLMTTRLDTFEAQLNAKIQEWTTAIVQGCQELEDKIDGIQEQLGEIQQKQDEHQNILDAILPRLEQVESTRLHSIPEVSVSPTGFYTADSVQSLP